MKNLISYRKDDDGKRRWRFLPLDVLNEVIDVLDQGADRYGVDNWKKCDDWDRYLDAMYRHISAWRLGEKNDPDSHRHHLAHAICCCIFLIWKDHQDAIHPKRGD